MEHRDRATGWKYAKLSGHRNEALVKLLLDEREDMRQWLLEHVHRPEAEILRTSVGGLHETSVPGVNGRKTKSKTDLKVHISTGEVLNISIKKSLSGQVYFVKATAFIETFEKQFSVSIPEEVKRAMRLFWSQAEDAISIIQQYADKTEEKQLNLQLKHRSLNAVTLRKYDETLYFALLNWFKDHAYEIARLCFSMGAVQNRNEWSDFIWYINLLEENTVNALFPIEDLCYAAKHSAENETYFSSLFGGTTIQLPFGFVQWHQGQMQFHHSYTKLSCLLSSCS